MKNLFLGILLTVGTSTFASATSSNVPFKKEAKEFISMPMITGSGSSEALVNCYYVTILELVDCDGSRQFVNLGGNAGECGPNDTDGSIIFNRIREEIAPEFCP